MGPTVYVEVQSDHFFSSYPEEVCEATLSVVCNQALNRDPDLPEFSLQRIFSPNYNEGKNYRKSTLCRYVGVRERGVWKEGGKTSCSATTLSLIFWRTGAITVEIAVLIMLK